MFFSAIACSVCGGQRLQREDGTPDVCSFLGCRAPMADYDRESAARSLDAHEAERARLREAVLETAERHVDLFAMWERAHKRENRVRLDQALRASRIAMRAAVAALRALEAPR